MARKPTGRPPGRPPLGPKAKDATLGLRLTSDGVTAIDERRGQWSRAEYVRKALALAIKHNLTGPKETP